MSFGSPKKNARDLGDQLQALGIKSKVTTMGILVKVEAEADDTRIEIFFPAVPKGSRAFKNNVHKIRRSLDGTHGE